MQIILSQQCESLTGSLGKGFGYHIERRKNGFFSKRSQRAAVPPDGHWQFIARCAELAQNKLHITDVKVHWMELQSALEEAHHFIAAQKVHDNYYGKGKADYNAADIINLKTLFGL